MIRTVKELYNYREMISSLIKRDLRGKYKASALGFLWTFLIPLFQLVIYNFIFSTILRSDIKDFYIFLIAGLFPWNFFSACGTSGASCIVNQENLIKKIYFPRLVLPVSFVTSSFINMLLTFIVVFVVLVFSGHGVNALALAYLPVVMLIEYILSLGLCMLTSALTVYFRDLEYIMGILMMAWIYLTPVFFEMNIVPDKFVAIFNINPMTPVIVAYQQILYYKQIPEMGNLLHATFLGVVVLIIVYLVFDKIQKRFVEEL